MYGVLHGRCRLLMARSAVIMYTVTPSTQTSAVRPSFQPTLRTIIPVTSRDMGVTDSTNKAAAAAMRPRNHAALSTQHFDAHIHLTGRLRCVCNRICHWHDNRLRYRLLHDCNNDWQTAKRLNLPNGTKKGSAMCTGSDGNIPITQESRSTI